MDEDRTLEPARSVLAAPQDPPPGQPDYNMAPTKQAAVVLTRRPREAGTAGAAAPPTAAPVRQLRLLTWGLVPSWATGVSMGLRLINARAETVRSKPAFRKILGVRRALIPADGWYEWQQSPVATDAKGKPRKQPFFISRADGHGLAFGGLYEFWRDPAAAPDDPLAWLTTFTIVTTAAEPGLDRIHDRQPLVVDPEDWSRWLDPDVGADDVLDLLAGQEPGRFTAYPITTAVNSSRNNGPALLDPAPPADLRGVVDPLTGEVLGG